MMVLLYIAENILLLSFTGLGFYFIEKHRTYLGPWKASVLNGLCFGLTAALVTAVPVTLGDGATVDARAGPVLLAGIVAGPVGGIIAAAMGGVSRGLVGGTFALSGIAAYVIYALIGMAMRHFRIVTTSTLLSGRSIGILVVASLFAAASIFFLIQPDSLALQWLRNDLPYILLANTLSVVYATVVLGISMILLRKSAELIKVNETLNLAKRAGGFGIWDYDLLNDELVWDERSKELHGVDPLVTTVTFSDWSNAVHPDDFEATLALYNQALAGEKTFDTEYRVIRPDGSTKSIKGDAIVVRDHGGKPVRVVGSNNDLTDIREAEAKLALARSVAAQAQRSETVGQLTGGVAHDFNNLLAVIVGSLELLKLEFRDESAREEASKLIEASIEAARRGAELTQNMLAYARKAQLCPELLNLNEVVRETETWLRRTIESRVEINLVLVPGVWVTRADKASVQSALVNLFVNARDAIEGSGVVAVETCNIEVTPDDEDSAYEGLPPGRYAVMVVADNGVGMSEDALEKIFDPFFTTKPVGKGTGLGLSMVQGFMEQSNGWIRVHSTPGKGTRFKLIFPVAETEAKDHNQTGSDPVDTLSQRNREGRILLVEDQKEVMEVLRRSLIQAGFDVVPAASGDEAYTKFQDDGQFDLVLTDVVMPGFLQGPSLAREIRKLQPDTRFIFLSGYASDAGDSGHDIGADDIRLMKPISRVNLLAAIEKRLAGRR